MHDSDYLKLTDSQMQTAIDWVRRFWGSRNCPACNKVHWEVAPHMAAANIFNKGRVALAGRVKYPTVMVFCTTCGYLVQFSAKMIEGLLDAE